MIRADVKQEVTVVIKMSTLDFKRLETDYKILLGQAAGKYSVVLEFLQEVFQEEA